MTTGLFFFFFLLWSREKKKYIYSFPWNVSHICLHISQRNIEKQKNREQIKRCFREKDEQNGDERRIKRGEMTRRKSSYRYRLAEETKSERN